MKFAKKRENWIDIETLELTNERKEIMKELNKNNDHVLLERGKSLRNKIQARIKNTKAFYIKGRLVNVKNDPKKFWREIHV